jgi:hypothetical protein
VSADVSRRAPANPEFADPPSRDRPVAFRSPDLDPFDLMLLTADGTVTTLLDACCGEAIVTRTTG